MSGQWRRLGSKARDFASLTIGFLDAKLLNASIATISWIMLFTIIAIAAADRRRSGIERIAGNDE